MPPRYRRLSDEDQALWHAFARQLKPLEGRAVPPEVPVSAPAVREVAPPVQAPVKVRAAPVAVGVAPGGLDRSSWQRLRTGRMEVERVLDLHGHTVERAHREFRHFMLAAQADGVRCVEVITGRGAGGGGVLRRELPEWLNGHELRGIVLAVVHPHVRNDGAVRILIRRRRGA